MSAPAPALLVARELAPQVVGDPGGRKHRWWLWLIVAALGMFVLLPAILLGGLSSEGCGAPVSSATPPGGPVPSGMFAQPLKLQQGKWYEVGATEYGGPSDPTAGTSGSITTPG